MAWSIAGEIITQALETTAQAPLVDSRRGLISDGRCRSRWSLNGAQVPTVIRVRSLGTSQEVKQPQQIRVQKKAEKSGLVGPFKRHYC